MPIRKTSKRGGFGKGGKGASRRGTFSYNRRTAKAAAGASQG